MFNKKIAKLGWSLVLPIVAGALFATAARNDPAALAQVSCVQEQVPCQGYNNPDPISGSALLPDLNGSWMDNGHPVVVTMVPSSNCLVSGTQVPCGGGSVSAMYVQPIVCDHRDGTGETDQTNVDFTGQLEDGTGGQPLDIVGTTSACQYGTNNPNGVGFHQTAIYLVVSADAQTLTGIWNNAGDNSPAQLTRVVSPLPPSPTPTSAASGTPVATPTSAASGTPVATPTSAAPATPAATPTDNSPGGIATNPTGAAPSNGDLLHVGANPSACTGPFSGPDSGVVNVASNVGQSTVDLNVSLQDALPNQTYVVDIRCVGQIGSVTTDSQGTGTARISLPISQVPAGAFYIDVSVAPPGGGGSGGYGDTFIAGPFALN